MKKVYTITFHHAHNYGAMLQAYALQQTVIALGWDNEILDFSEDKIELLRLYRKNQSFKQEVIKHNIMVLKNFSDNKKQFNLIEGFYRDNLCKTKKISSIHRLKNYAFESTNFLIGSDQMWNFKGMTQIPEYINLSFINKKIHYSTYAVSMGGVYHYTEKIEKEFKEMLSRTEKISVREASMKKELYDLYGIESIVVEDPVFLLESKKWEDLADSAIFYNLPEKYIFCFELVPHLEFQGIINELKKQYKLPVIVLTMAISSKLEADQVIRAAGPKEFINFIRHAEIVVSTSFHCAAFSIIFHKTIYSLLTTHAPARIVELMNKYGLKNGLIKDRFFDKYFISEEQWKAIDVKVKAGRELSIEFLRSLEKTYE